ncbi:hypothetical protein EYZ11_002220 [Aspergillus tanneri]|uniref:Calcineurin-like phosphoesterase domain-containing protein n=1 Tax=Aspergillus tanneri TaxID=1220188 RepID=A0A4S3JTC8_9EURO|nr:uncharacterized protein ATNIH1004_000484 [Aspergillus tanneri]KAA8651594.1 hypothetical protein ATNIH1004_000484 [Aspergillus tanneri]THC98287.1 hypothetical protein EYZ11_002220 [Aspergillus tanneri]
MARFQILSDLHLENPCAYDAFDVPPQAPYLALLGDIGNVRDEGLFLFLEVQLRKFQIVFFLLGNHEPYHFSWTTARERVVSFEQTIRQRRAQKEQTDSQPLGQFVFLDRRRYDLSSDVTVLGCTLHSHVPPAQVERVSYSLNDFYHINNWTVEEHNAAHDADRSWLNTQVSSIEKSEPNRKIVIFSHHSPTEAESAVDPAHANSSISSGFATDMTKDPCWKSFQVQLWASGHTHYNFDFTDEKTGMRVMANQRGYYFAQAKGFDVEKVVEI